MNSHRENSRYGTLMPLSEKEYKDIALLVYNHFGINLTDQKKSLIVGRLQKIVTQKGFANFRDYIAYVVADQSKQALSELVNKISTNHTYFYREKDHFEFFMNRFLPEVSRKLKTENSRDLRIWCAGCSSGEEPYTLMMLMQEYFGNEYHLWDAGLLATDISEKALLEAKRGVYSSERVKLLPPNLKNKYLTKTGREEWAVNEKVRKEVLLRRFNLMNPTFPFKKKFHAIFCRNVMIYFDKETRDSLVEKFFDFTLPGGYLFIGHSESLGREKCKYDYIMPAVYRKSG